MSSSSLILIPILIPASRGMSCTIRRSEKAPLPKIIVQMARAEIRPILPCMRFDALRRVLHVQRTDM